MGASAIGSGIPARARSPAPPERHPGYPLRVFFHYDVLMCSCASIQLQQHEPGATRSGPTSPARATRVRPMLARLLNAFFLVPTSRAPATIFMGRLHPRRSAASYRHAAAITPARITRVRSMFARLPDVLLPQLRLRLLSPHFFVSRSTAVPSCRIRRRGSLRRNDLRHFQSPTHPPHTTGVQGYRGFASLPSRHPCCVLT